MGGHGNPALARVAEVLFPTRREGEAAARPRARAGLYIDRCCKLSTWSCHDLRILTGLEQVRAVDLARSSEVRALLERLPVLVLADARSMAQFATDHGSVALVEELPVWLPEDQKLFRLIPQNPQRAETTPRPR